MLYDVLPPTIFFTSLGGVILTVSRVILRIRREQVTHTTNIEIRNQVSDNSKPVDIANLVGPTKKSVHIIKNRLALVRQTVQDSTRNLKTDWNHRKEVRAERKEEKRSNKVKKLKQKKSVFTKLSKTPDSLSAPDSTEMTTNEIVEPKAPLLRNTINSIGPKAKSSLLLSALKLKKAGSIVAKASSALKEKLPKKKEAVVEEHETSQPAKPKLRLVNTDDAKANSANVDTKKNESQTIAGLPVTQKGLRKIFNKEVKKTPLDEAQQELNAANYQNVDNILVPYLMKNPRNADAYMLLGKAALGRHAWEEATEIFEQAVAINPTAKGNYASLGYAAYRTGKLTKALEALQKAHTAEPNNVVIIKRLLTIAQHMDNQPMQRSLEEKLTDLQADQK